MNHDDEVLEEWLAAWNSNNAVISSSSTDGVITVELRTDYMGSYLIVEQL